MFELHPRLTEDTLPVVKLALSEVRLMNDARYPWLILIPQIEDVVEVHHLHAKEQTALISESSRCAAALEGQFQPDKFNIGALGNLVPQLHWHVIARFRDDPAWPGPVWGHSRPQPYSPSEAETLTAKLKQALSPC